MSDHVLESIYLTSGVNECGEGFVTVAAHSSGGTVLVGQLDPATTRMLGFHYLEVAEAAEQDAAVLRLIRKLGLDESLAGHIITELRQGREP
jgi:hypothetical protein